MKARSLLLAIAIVSLLFFLTGNASLPITDPVESNYALTAKEMVLSGDWISPRIFDTFWYDKPIFIYWMLSLSYTLLGFSDFASRLPGAVFGMGSVVLFSWYLLHRGTRRELAVLGAAVMATSLEVWAVSHSIITDQILFFFTEATLFFAYIGLTENRSPYMTAAYAMAALAVLTKGPVGIVLPGTFCWSLPPCAVMHHCYAGFSSLRELPCFSYSVCPGTELCISSTETILSTDSWDCTM